MPNIFASLDIGSRALKAFQTSLMVTGRNIANVNTPGFSREQVELSSLPEGESGGGVEVQSIHRVRDNFTDALIRNEMQVLGEWETRSKTLSSIEDIFGEPKEGALSDILAQFWDGWQELANNPESKGTREVVLQRGAALASTLNRLDSSLQEAQVNLSKTISSKVKEINDLAQQIANLNAQIPQIGKDANELLDKRDLLIDRLAKMVNITSNEEKNGQISIFIEGQALVSGDNYINLSVNHKPLALVSLANTAQTSPASQDSATRNILWEDGSSVNISSGELKGLLQVQNVTVPDFLSRLDSLASSLITEVNALHAAGYGVDGVTLRNFFDGANASDIAVKTEIVEDPSKIAASEASLSGDNRIAMRIGQLRYQKTLIDSEMISFDDFYNSTIASLGAESRYAKNMAESQRLLTESLENQRESISGVSLDEEMTNLIKFQRAYEAAARYISVVDEMLRTLISQAQ